MRQGIPPSGDQALKDSRSEPDCTRPLLVPPANIAPVEISSPVTEVPATRRHMLSRSQVSNLFHIAYKSLSVFF